MTSPATDPGPVHAATIEERLTQVESPHAVTPDELRAAFAGPVRDWDNEPSPAALIRSLDRKLVPNPPQARFASTRKRFLLVMAIVEAAADRYPDEPGSPRSILVDAARAAREAAPNGLLSPQIAYFGHVLFPHVERICEPDEAAVARLPDAAFCAYMVLSTALSSLDVSPSFLFQLGTMVRMGAYGINPHVLSAIIRDIIPNDKQMTVQFNPAWRNEEVRGLATEIFDKNAFDRLPALADELEDAGCADPDFVGHCREPGPHVKGCWAVELVLGRTLTAPPASPLES